MYIILEKSCISRFIISESDFYHTRKLNDKHPCFLHTYSMWICCFIYTVHIASHKYSMIFVRPTLHITCFISKTREHKVTLVIIYNFYLQLDTL